MEVFIFVYMCFHGGLTFSMVVIAMEDNASSPIAHNNGVVKMTLAAWN